MIQINSCTFVNIHKNTITLSMSTLNCKGKILDLTVPKVMGIINITPDSFFEGYRDQSNDQIIGMARNMLFQGAAILDIGGQSTRPGSARISASEEISRVIPVIKSLHQHLPDAILSIDTYYSEVAKMAVEAGASVINDISSGEFDKNMIELVSKLNVPYICMHIQGTPETMQNAPDYTDVVKEILEFFIKKVSDCKKAGIKDIIIDPGFGFGKNINHNFQLLKELNVFNVIDCPILVGLSRKGMIYKSIGASPADALNGTTVVNTLALHNGASILRVHDVKEAVESIKLYELYKNAAPL